MVSLLDIHVMYFYNTADCLLRSVMQYIINALQAAMISKNPQTLPQYFFLSGRLDQNRMLFVINRFTGRK